MPPDFSSQAYWHKRFQTESIFDWLLPSDRFLELLEPVLAQLASPAHDPRHLASTSPAPPPPLTPQSSSSSSSSSSSASSSAAAAAAATTLRILNLGSGTSDLHVHLRAKGYNNVTNLDYEPLAVERGEQLERKAFGDVVMRYVVADATCLTAESFSSGLTDEQLQRDGEEGEAQRGACEDGLDRENAGDSGSGTGEPAFDLVVDKSTADAIACAGDDAFRDLVRGVTVMLERRRGVWISLSYSSSRFDGMEALGFDVQVLAKVPTRKEKEHDPDVFL